MRAQAGELVESPDGVFAFGTGGAVKLTVARDGRILDLEAACNERQLLDEAMTGAGFVGIDRAVGRYELETALWATVAGRDPVLDRVLAPPTPEGPAARPPVVPDRPGSWHAGAAWPFLSPREGREAMAPGHRGAHGHYYARASHRDVDALAELLRRQVFASEGVQPCISGLAAARHAVRALMPDQGGVLLHAADVYHECKLAFREEGRLRGWNVRQAERLPDVLDALNAPDALDGSRAVDVVFVDSPSGWGLSTQDIPALAGAVHELGAKLIVDVTLQPLQPALREGADMVVCSLSKDVSLGYALAGAVAANETIVLDQIAAAAALAGEQLAAQTAHTVQQQAVSLRDRLDSQAGKMTLVEDVLRAHFAVREVHVAARERCGGLPGSQLAFSLLDPAQGTPLEQVIGHRSLDLAASLSLAASFGLPFTTVEHFATRFGIWTAGAKPTIPIDRVRVGLGCEPGEKIAAELRLRPEREPHADLSGGGGSCPTPLTARCPCRVCVSVRDRDLACADRRLRWPRCRRSAGRASRGGRVASAPAGDRARFARRISPGKRAATFPGLDARRSSRLRCEAPRPGATPRRRRPRDPPGSACVHSG